MKNLNPPTRIILSALVLGACTALLTSCQTPDLKPFRDSTVKIHDSVVQAQEAYVAGLDLLERNTASATEFADQKKRFSTNWQARVEVMEAMVRYAGSLAAVADAPNNAKAGLDSVAQSIKDLSIAAGPYQSVVEGATGLGTELVDLANRVRAAQQLKKAVLMTDPDMQRVAKLLLQDFSATRFALEQDRRSIKNVMDREMAAQLDVRNAVERKIREKSAQIKTDGPDWTNAVAVYNQETAEAKKYLAEADQWYLPHQAKVQAAEKQLSESIALFRDTEASLVQWAKAHSALAQSLQAGLAPDWTLLKQSADRIEKSINKITNR